MPKYDVRLTRSLHEEAFIIGIEAASEEDAIDQAMREVSDLDWILIDGFEQAATPQGEVVEAYEVESEADG